jgi:hypothetical protein
MGDLAMVNFWGDREAVDTKPDTRAVSALSLQHASSFLLPGVLSLTLPEKVGGNEVKQ